MFPPRRSRFRLCAFFCPVAVYELIADDIPYLLANP